MNKAQQKQTHRIARRRRIRAKVFGTADCPRLAVFRSNRELYAQLIDDAKGATLAASDTRHAEGEGVRAKARATGAALAKKAGALGITRAVFDRGGFLYTGSIAELADGAREGGLQF